MASRKWAKCGVFAARLGRLKYIRSKDGLSHFYTPNMDAMHEEAPENGPCNVVMPFQPNGF